MYGIDDSKSSWRYDPSHRQPKSGSKLRRTHSANVTHWEQLYNSSAQQDYRAAPLYNRYGSYRQLSYGDLQEEPEEDPWIYREENNNCPPQQQQPQQPPPRMPMHGGRTSAPVLDGRQTVPLPESRQESQPSPAFRSSFRGYSGKKGSQAERKQFPDRKEGDLPKKGKGSKGLSRVRSFLGFSTERSQSVPSGTYANSDQGKDQGEQAGFSVPPKEIRKMTTDIDNCSEVDAKEKRRSLQINRNWSPALDTCYEHSPNIKSQSLDRRGCYNVPQNRRPYLDMPSPDDAKRRSVGYPGYFSPYPDRGMPPGDYPYPLPNDESRWCYLYWSEHDGMK